MVLAKELASLKEEEELLNRYGTFSFSCILYCCLFRQGRSGIVELRRVSFYVSSTNQTPSMSPGARSARVRLLETLLNSSSTSLVAMASQLSEAEERERVSGGRVRWQHLRSMGDAKILLQFGFDAAALAR